MPAVTAVIGLELVPTVLDPAPVPTTFCEEGTVGEAEAPVDDGLAPVDVDVPVLAPGVLVEGEPGDAVPEFKISAGPTPVSASKVGPPLGFGPGNVVPETAGGGVGAE